MLLRLAKFSDFNFNFRRNAIAAVPLSVVRSPNLTLQVFRQRSTVPGSQSYFHLAPGLDHDTSIL